MATIPKYIVVYTVFFFLIPVNTNIIMTKNDIPNKAKYLILIFKNSIFSMCFYICIPLSTTSFLT